MDNDQISLDGAWKLRWADGQRGGLLHHHLWTTHPSKWIDAIVPGEVHLDLLRAGMIPEPALGGQHFRESMGRGILLKLSPCLFRARCSLVSPILVTIRSPRLWCTHVSE